MMDQDWADLQPGERAKLVDMALRGPTPDSPDRLELSSDIADLAAHVKQQMEQMTDAETIYDSELSDQALADVRAHLTRVNKEMGL